MGATRLKRRALTLVMIAAAVLLGAMLGRAQSAFPVRFDDGGEEAMVVSVNAAVAEAFRLVPLDAPPVPCDANHQGYAYLQNDVGATDTAWERQVCICVATDSGGPFWWSHTISCDDLMN